MDQDLGALERRVRAEPGAADARRALASAYERAGDVAGLERLTGAHEDDLDVQRALARAYEGAGRPDEAYVQLVSHALAGDPSAVALGEALAGAQHDALLTVASNFETSVALGRDPAIEPWPRLVDVADGAWRWDDATVALSARRPVLALELHLVEPDDAEAVHALSTLVGLRVFGSALDPTCVGRLGLGPCLESLSLEAIVPDEWGEALGPLASLPRLQCVRVVEAAIGRAGFAALAELPGLIALLVPGADLDDEALGRLCAAGRLEVLDLTATTISGETLTALARLENLVDLDLGATNLGDDDLARLRGLPLHTVGLAQVPITGVGLKDVASPFLRVLDLSATDIDGASLWSLAAATELHTLRLADTNAGSGVGALVRNEQLVSLDLSRTRPSRSALQALAAHPSLRDLKLQGVDVTDGMGAIAGLVRLEALDLRASTIDDQGVMHLARCDTLRLLRLGGSRVTSRGVERLREALPGCEVLL